MSKRELLPHDFGFRAWRAALLLWVVLGCQTINSRVTAANLTWTGAGANNYWTTSGNWGGKMPEAGDNLLFPGGSVDVTSLNNTNDLASNTVFRTITITGTNYGFYGNQLLFTNSGVVAISAQSGGSNTVGFPVQLGGNSQTFNCTLASGTLVMNGALNLNGQNLTNNPIGEVYLGGLISGTGNLVKSGAGRLVLNGITDNTYAGTAIVTAGNLRLNDASVGTAVMIPGDLIINAGVTVDETKSDQIADAANVIVNGTGTYNLVGGANDTIRSLTLSAGNVTTSTGMLTLGGNITNLASGSGISGNLALGGAIRTLQMTASGLTISAVISDGATPGAGLIQAGPGQLTLSGANTYTGPTIVSLAILANGWALGASGTANSGTTLTNVGATLLVQGVEIGDEFLTLGDGVDFRSSGSASWSGPLELTGMAGFNVLSGTFTNRGVISGVGGFAKGQPGTLILAGDSGNTFTGPVLVNAGVLELAKAGAPALGPVSSLTIGDGLGGADADVVRYRGDTQMASFPILINASGLLDLNGNTDEVGPITMDASRIATGAGQLQMEGDLVAYNLAGTNANPSISGRINLFGADRTFNVTNTDLTVTATILDLSTNGILKTGIGHLFLSNSNSYKGITIVQQGWLWAQNASALGDTNNGTVVSNNASLVLNGPFGVTNESLTLNGLGASEDWGGLDSEAIGTSYWAGPITLNGNCTIAPYGDSTVLRLNGVISGPGGFTLFANGTAGTLVIEGTTANVFSGTARVNSGTLLLGKTPGQNAISGNLIIGDGIGGVNADVVRMMNHSQLAYTADVLVNSSGLLDLVAFVQAFDTLHGPGNVTLGVGAFDIGVNHGSSAFEGVISDSGFPDGYAIGKHGVGVFALSGNNTYLNETHVFNGMVWIFGSQPRSHIALEAAGGLAGTGIVGNITNVSGGSVRPGGTPGILTCSNVVFSGASSDFTVEVNGTTPGSGHDQLNVRGSCGLDGCALNVALGDDFFPALGVPLVILNNDGDDAIMGNFAGLPEGAIKTAGAFRFIVSYLGGSGNDVTLTLTNSTTVSAIVAKVVGGNGDNAIDPNECNHLYLVITNIGDVPVTGISATLSTTSDHVIVTQPSSGYPDLTVNGESSNTTPFQITTLPALPCGSGVELVLTLNTSAGSFVSTYTQPGGGIGCADGGGTCETCPGRVAGSISLADPTNANRLVRNLSPATCAAPLACSGVHNANGPFHYDTHDFTNPGGPACITVYLDTSLGETLTASAYLGSYTAANVCLNLLAEMGSIPSKKTDSFSFTLPGSTNFVVVVNAVDGSAGYDYSLVVTGVQCPAPLLNITPTTANQVQLDWSTAAAGYLLETTNNLPAGLAPSAAWSEVTNAPVVAAGRFTVTNTIANTNNLFRLRKPLP